MPLYLDIAADLLKQINNAEPGRPLPSERELAQAWCVARPTISRAIDALKVIGAVEARHGSGTYAVHPDDHDRTADQYRQEISNALRLPGSDPTAAPSSSG